MTADESFAADLARSTGAVLQQVRRDRGDLPLRELKDAGDAAAQAHIAARIADTYPHDAVLSEEAPDSTARLAADRVWIIDPLDGTREYAEGRADWAVHIALWQRSRHGDTRYDAVPVSADAPADRSGGALTVGAVAIPDENLVLNSGDTTGPGADGASPRTASYPDAAAYRTGDHGPLRIAVSRTRPPEVVHRVVDILAADGVATELVPMGSAGVKISAVVRGQVDAYLHAGGQYQWDSAAPVAVARDTGLHTSRIDGTPLVYNGPDAWLPDLLVCGMQWADALLAAVNSDDGGSL